MLRQLDLRGQSAATAVLPRPALDEDGPVKDVRAILAAVRQRGDAALREYTERFDHVAIDDFEVPHDELERAFDRLAPDLAEALSEAHAAISAFHHAERVSPPSFHRDGIVVEHLVLPVDRAGVYVPGGLARYPSTVLMTAVPAREAGVASVICCVPPDAAGNVPDEVLAAAHLARVDAVYRVGGAQAIAAMAYGTETIGPVDVIAGPGNKWVSIAQREVRGLVGVPAAFAGPSEVVVIADETTPVDFAAIDVIVQAEHGPDGLCWLITWSEAAGLAISAAVERLAAASPRREATEQSLARGGYVVLVDDARQAFEVANRIAPEHLEIMAHDPTSLVPLVRHAGAVFLGPYAPASVGDYLAGPSHVLPTHGTARFASVLGVEDFSRRLHTVSVTQQAMAHVAPMIATIARAEGLVAHAESALMRVDAANVERAMSAGEDRITPRPALGLMEGYHSPQLDVAYRMNTNEAPEAPPAAFVAALQEAIGDVSFNRYPDLAAESLRSALAGLHGVSKEEVYCANGSNEVLQAILLAFGGAGRSAAVFEPTYAMHSHIAHITGTAVVIGERDDEFFVSEAEFDRVLAEAARDGSGNPAVCFLCSPNNPTGRVEPARVIEMALAHAPGLVIVDEAYGQFAPQSALELRAAHANLVVLRTFSKTWSLAALRLGYAIAHPKVIAALESVTLPYHLDAMKQLAGRLALDFEDEMRARVARIVEERGRLVAGLQAMAVTICPSEANFILFRIDDRNAKSVWQALVADSVLVRDVSSWPRLAGHLRVSVGTREENDAFLESLAKALA